MPFQPIAAFFPLDDKVLGGVSPRSVPITPSPARPLGTEAILFTGGWIDGPGHIYKVSPDGTGLTQVTTAPANTFDTAAWAPGATKFAVARQANAFGGGASLLVANADGSSLTTIWTGSGSAFPASQPSWTADGKTVVIAYEAISGQGKGYGAAFVNADGSGHTLVPISVPNVRDGVGGVIDTDILDSGMYLSPDGVTLAFSIFYSSGNDQFFPAICPVAGGTATVLTAPVPPPIPNVSGKNAWTNAWFADSRHLLCYGNGPPAPRLFKLSTGVGSIIDLVGGLAGIPEFQACLSPDNSRIANTDSDHGLTIDPIAPGPTTTAVPKSPLAPAIPSWGGGAAAVGEVVARTAMGGIRHRGKVMGGVSASDVHIIGGIGGPPTPPPAASGYDAVVLGTAGLTGYWPLSETSGTVAHDLAGSNPGTYAGGFTLGQAGMAGSVAARFDGASGKVTVPDASELSSDTQYSIEVWFHAFGGDNLNTAPGPFIGKIDGSLGIGYAIQLEDSASTIDGGTRAYEVTTWDAAGGVENGLGVPVDDDPHYFAVTVDQTNVKMYINGVLRLTTTSELTGTSTVTTNPLRFAFSPRSETPGAVFLPGTGDFYYKGLLQRLAFYRSTVLSAADITHHWTAGSS